MKIIDEKGRLFGKINLIDFLVLMFLFCLMPMAYFGYRFLTTSPVEPGKKELIELELDCKLIKLTTQDLNNISVGEKELDGNGQVMAEIIALGESEPFSYELDLGAGPTTIKEDTILKQVPTRLKLKVELKEDKPHYQNQPLQLDLPFELKIKDTYFTAVPISFKTLTKELDLNVILEDLSDSIIKKISVGDKEEDRKGNTIAEIVELGKIEVSSFEVDLGRGSYATGENIERKQLSVKMRLLCKIKDLNQIYFKNKRIEANSHFEFNTGKYKVMARVAKTFERTSPVAERWIRLQVKFSGVMPEIANLIKKGDTEKDPYNNIVATINSLIFNRPSEVLAIKNDKFITLNHPFNRDILSILDVQCLNKEGIYYFHNYPIKIGNNITFTTELYSLTGEITGMEIK